MTTAHPEAGAAEARASGRSVPWRRIVPLAALALLLAAMVWDTRFLTSDEVTKLRPAEFDAKTYAAETFPKLVKSFTAEGAPLADIVPALDQDPRAAAQQFGGFDVSGKVSFPTTITATVREVDANFMLLDTPDLPRDAEVRIPVGVAVNGTPVRDAAGIEFADFEGQTDYQAAANEFKTIMMANVIGSIDPTSLKGKQITVVGAFSTGGPPDSYIVQPVSIEVGGQ